MDREMAFKFACLGLILAYVCDGAPEPGYGNDEAYSSFGYGQQSGYNYDGQENQRSLYAYQPFQYFWHHVNQDDIGLDQNSYFDTQLKNLYPYSDIKYGEGGNNGQHRDQEFYNTKHSWYSSPNQEEPLTADIQEDKTITTFHSQTNPEFTANKADEISDSKSCGENGKLKSFSYKKHDIKSDLDKIVETLFLAFDKENDNDSNSENSNNDNNKQLKAEENIIQKPFFKGYKEQEKDSFDISPESYKDKKDDALNKDSWAQQEIIYSNNPKNKVNVESNPNETSNDTSSENNTVNKSINIQRFVDQKIKNSNSYTERIPISTEAQNSSDDVTSYSEESYDDFGSIFHKNEDEDKEIKDEKPQMDFIFSQDNGSTSMPDDTKISTQESLFSSGFEYQKNSNQDQKEIFSIQTAKPTENFEFFKEGGQKKIKNKYVNQENIELNTYTPYEIFHIFDIPTERNFLKSDNRKDKKPLEQQKFNIDEANEKSNKVNKNIHSPGTTENIEISTGENSYTQDDNSNTGISSSLYDLENSGIPVYNSFINRQNMNSDYNIEHTTYNDDAEKSKQSSYLYSEDFTEQSILRNSETVEMNTAEPLTILGAENRKTKEKVHSDFQQQGTLDKKNDTNNQNTDEGYNYFSKIRNDSRFGSNGQNYNTQTKFDQNYKDLTLKTTDRSKTSAYDTLNSGSFANQNNTDLINEAERKMKTETSSQNNETDDDTYIQKTVYHKLNSDTDKIYEKGKLNQEDVENETETSHFTNFNNKKEDITNSGQEHWKQDEDLELRQPWIDKGGRNSDIFNHHDSRYHHYNGFHHRPYGYLGYFGQSQDQHDYEHDFGGRHSSYRRY